MFPAELDLGRHVLNELNWGRRWNELEQEIVALSAIVRERKALFLKIHPKERSRRLNPYNRAMRLIVESQKDNDILDILVGLVSSYLAANDQEKFAKDFEERYNSEDVVINEIGVHEALALMINTKSFEQPRNKKNHEGNNVG